MGKFEQYLQDFTNTINIQDFLLNLLIAAILSTALRFFYIRFGQSVSNRVRFASNFLPLALATMLIITIVKTSIALSLGLVGALSIVRFRSAIKDPEELTFLFLVIGLGLACGANQPLLAVVAFAAILLLLYLNNLTSGHANFKQEDRLYVNIQSDIDDLDRINGILTNIMPYVELKRLDKQGVGLDLTFTCKAQNIAQINKLKTELTNLSPKTTFSFIDQPDLIV